MEKQAERKGVLPGIKYRLRNLERDQKRALFANVFMFAILAGEIAIYAYSDAVQGRGLGFLGMLYGVDPLAGEEELQRFQLYLSRTIFLTAFGQVLLTAALLHRRTYRLLNDFFTTATHPLNLAIFRITVFGLFLYTGYGAMASWYAGLPEELRFPPYGIGRLVDYGLDELVYFAPQQVEVAYVVFLVCCVTGLLGFFSRTSAFIVAMLAAFPLAAPEFFGKVNHGMHLIWFSGLLAFSPCGEVLSIDAIWRSWKMGLQSTLRRLRPARAYALPLSFAMLLIGIAYFFPGFWKMWDSGLEWALSDSLKNVMHQKWYQLRPWTPFFQIDQYPLLYRVGGLGTILFELSFIFLILHPRTRLFAVLGGIGFHTMTNLFLAIDFFTLYAFYIVFVDWHRVFRRVGDAFYKQPVYVVQPSEGAASRLIAVCEALDVFDQIRPASERARSGEAVAGPQATEREGIVVDAGHLDASDRRALIKRVPLLWPAYPVLGRFFGRREQRRSDLAKSPSGQVGYRKEFRLSAASVAVVGALIVAGNVFCGVKGMSQAWPFACYPTFSGLRAPTFEVLTVDVQTDEGNTMSMPLDEVVLGSTPMAPVRFTGLMRDIIGWGPEGREARLDALWRFLAEEDPSLASVQEVTFYKIRLRSAPEYWEEPPIDRQVVLEFRPEVESAGGESL